MKRQGMSLRAALALVILARPKAVPNPGFLLQLQELEQELFGCVTWDLGELPRVEKARLALFRDTGEKGMGVPPPPGGSVLCRDRLPSPEHSADVK